MKVGVGLRHLHYAEMLDSKLEIDFVEVHAENFFADGGATLALLDDVAERLPISLHATSLGLGSFREIPLSHVDKLKRLVDRVSPFLVSDHACFAWSSLREEPIHAGDLLPVFMDHASLGAMARNVTHVQSHLARTLLVENIASYVMFQRQSMDEAQFLVALCSMTGCKILLDLNNLVVNATNASVTDVHSNVISYLHKIPEWAVGEIHLAGCAPVPPGGLMVDDHSRPVPPIVWDIYRVALRRFGPIPTLIEWDTNLPSWQELVAQATIAREIAAEIFLYSRGGRPTRQESAARVSMSDVSENS